MQLRYTTRAISVENVFLMLSIMQSRWNNLITTLTGLNIHLCCSKYYEKDALMAEQVDGLILASLLGT